MPLRRKKKFLEGREIRSNRVKEMGLSCQKRFEKGGLQAMLRKKIDSFLLRLRYLKLLAEIKVLIGLSGIRKDLDFRRAKP